MVIVYIVMTVVTTVLSVVSIVAWVLVMREVKVVEIIFVNVIHGTLVLDAVNVVRAVVFDGMTSAMRKMSEFVSHT